MAKFKIKKGLSDQDMFKGFVEEESFETAVLRDEEEKKTKIAKRNAPTSQEAFYREFLTEAIETQIGKALLDIKMEYYREDVSSFFVEVRKDGKNIVLVTGPKKDK